MRKSVDAVSAPAAEVSLAAEEHRQCHQDHPKSAALKRLEASEAPRRVDQGIHVEEEGTVHQRVVGVVLPGGEEPGEVGVQALVVVQGARPEIPEARQHCRHQDQRVECRFQSDSDRCRDPDRRCGRRRGQMGGILVAHRERPSAVAVGGDVARRARLDCGAQHLVLAGTFPWPAVSPVPRGRSSIDERAPRASGAPAVRRSAGVVGLAAAGFLFALAAAEVPFLATFAQPIETKGWLLERLQPFFPAHRQRHARADLQLP